MAPKFEANELTALKNELIALKRDLLNPINELSQFPCDIDMQGTPETQQILRHSIYDSMLKLLVDYGDKLSPHNLSYVASNLHCQSNNMKELIGELEKKKNDLENNSYHSLGFRSIYLILNENITYIKPNYIYNIYSMLRPFFERYRYQNRLTSWLGISTDEFC
jgi:hypothetical protein